MLASVTPLPVIGVPVPLQHLDGMDSLLSIVQMPAGVPVATVSVGGRAQRRAARRPDPGGRPGRRESLRHRMSEFQADLGAQAHAKGERLRSRRAGSVGFGAADRATVRTTTEGTMAASCHAPCSAVRKGGDPAFRCGLIAAG